MAGQNILVETQQGQMDYHKQPAIVMDHVVVTIFIVKLARLGCLA
jgi:hypothetical protein